MTIPHHGGMISASPIDEVACLRRLYTDLIKPDLAIVSVGTDNRYGHPNVETIRTLRDVGIKVLCTQMTERCADDLEGLRPLRTILAGPSRSTLSSVVTQGGKSKNVACFGTVVAEVLETSVKISGLGRYERDMGALLTLKGFNPLCRPKE
jgi:hypothetical protein